MEVSKKNVVDLKNEHENTIRKLHNIEEEILHRAITLKKEMPNAIVDGLEAGKHNLLQYTYGYWVEYITEIETQIKR